jgi:hypothetical protein
VHSTHTHRKYRHRCLLHQIAASCPFILFTSSLAYLFCTVHICFYHPVCHVVYHLVYPSQMKLIYIVAVVQSIRSLALLFIQTFAKYKRDRK